MQRFSQFDASLHSYDARMAGYVYLNLGILILAPSDEEKVSPAIPCSSA